MNDIKTTPLTPLITVITLSYFSPDLYAAIDSVLMQTYKRIQYILIDDGTGDFIEETVCSYVESHRNSNIEKYIVIKNPKNYGTVRAMNIALAYAEGEYIFNLSGDDVFADSSVPDDWIVAFKQTGALIMTAYREIYDVDMTLRMGRMPTAAEVSKIRRLAPRELFDEVAKSNFIFGCCTAYSHCYFKNYGKYDERYRLIEDHSMILRALRQNVTIAFFDRVVVYYRSGGSSSASRYNEIYERDVDLIYEYEVIPHTKNQKQATALYKKWKSRHSAAHKLAIRLKSAEGKPARRFFLQLCFYARYPMQSLGGILANPVKIMKLFRNI